MAQGCVARLCGARGPAGEIAAQYETAIKKIWDGAEFKEFMNRRGFDMIYLDLAGSQSS